MIGRVQEESERAAKLVPKTGHGEHGSYGHGKILRRLSWEYIEAQVSVQPTV